MIVVIRAALRLPFNQASGDLIPQARQPGDEAEGFAEVEEPLAVDRVVTDWQGGKVARRLRPQVPVEAT
jgi:hypothetical protein